MAGDDASDSAPSAETRTLSELRTQQRSRFGSFQRKKSRNTRGQKLNTNFFSQTFRAPPGYPGKIPAKKFDFPGFEGHVTYRTFWPPPLHAEDPCPTGNIRTQKFGFVLFFVSENWARLVSKQGIMAFAWRPGSQYDVAAARCADSVLASDCRAQFGRPSTRQGCRICVTVRLPVRPRGETMYWQANANTPLSVTPLLNVPDEKRRRL